MPARSSSTTRRPKPSTSVPPTTLTRRWWRSPGARVGSTQRAAQLGDAALRQILDRHDALVREQVALHRGRFIESSGDGTLATFESPSRAIDCALALHQATKPLGISLRAGLHTGEAE